MLEHRVIPALSFLPAFVLECIARQAEHKLCAELLPRQITFAAETFRAALVEDEHGRRPQCVEAVEERSGFLDVGGYRDKILIDEQRELRVGVRFGFQPNTSASRGRGTEVEQHGFVFGFGAGERTVEVFAPLNGHASPPETVCRIRDASDRRVERLESVLFRIHCDGSAQLAQGVRRMIAGKHASTLVFTLLLTT